MERTIKTCPVIRKQEYWHGKPKIEDGKCFGYVSSKRPYDTLSTCRKCKFYVEDENG